VCRGHRSKAAIEQFIQTGRTVAVRLHKEVKTVDRDDEARNFPSTSQCVVPLGRLLAYVNQPAAFVNVKAEWLAHDWLQIVTER
jgi:hypothetical protein